MKKMETRIFRIYKFVLLIVMFSLLSGVASADQLGTITVDSCSTDGVVFSASGNFTDNDGVIKFDVYANGVWRAGNTYGSPQTGKTSWSVSGIAVPFGHEYTCISVIATITDVNDVVTTSAPCKAGVPEAGRCWDGKENDCDGKTDCVDNDCYGQCSPNKPKYCDNGVIIDKCQICGCPPDKPDCCDDGTCVPEFSTIAIPVAAILGLVFLFSRRRRKP